MGRPKLGTEYKKPSDYHYDYPKNRKIFKHLSWEDKQLISHKTGYTTRYVCFWGLGTRKNKRIEEWARKIAILNIAKLRKLNNQDKCGNVIKSTD